MPVTLFLLYTLLVYFSTRTGSNTLLKFALTRGIIVPSLLPLLVLFGLIRRVASRGPTNGFSGQLVHILFRLPNYYFPAILFNLVNNCPTNTLLATSLCNSRGVAQHRTYHVVQFGVDNNTNFVVATIKIKVLGDGGTKLVLFTSMATTTVVYTTVDKVFTRKRGVARSRFTEPHGANSTLGGDMRTSLRDILGLSTCVVLFYTFRKVLRVSRVLTPVVRVADNVAGTSNELALPRATFLLTFNKFYIRLRVLPMLGGVGVPCFGFFT